MVPVPAGVTGRTNSRDGGVSHFSNPASWSGLPVLRASLIPGPLLFPAPGEFPRMRKTLCPLYQT